MTALWIIVGILIALTAGLLIGLCVIISILRDEKQEFVKETLRLDNEIYRLQNRVITIEYDLDIQRLKINELYDALEQKEKEMNE